MDKVITILYEDSSAANAAREYYDDLGKKYGLGFHWIHDSKAAAQSYDGFLLTGREHYDALHNNEWSVVVSDNREKRLVALFSRKLNFQENTPSDLNMSVDFAWQGEMISRFLHKALPVSYQCSVKAEVVNESSDERLARLDTGATDIAVIPLHHLNAMATKAAGYRFMVLPLFECTPAIYQGVTAIAVKSDHENFLSMFKDAADRETVSRTGAENNILQSDPGRRQGVLALNLANVAFTYVASSNYSSYGGEWREQALAELPIDSGLFSTTDHMKDFFDYAYNSVSEIPASNNFFIATHKAVEPDYVSKHLSDAAVWAAGTKTWYDLAKKNYWVNGCADGIGLESLTNTWAGSFLSINKTSLCIITNTSSAKHWQRDGYTAVGTYDLVPRLSTAIIEGLRRARAVFWTSYQQSGSFSIYQEFYRIPG
ncbi:MAG: hypothetical protein EOO04_14875 [Chitinophagaceae bacterium]|nr:MAG: hypothetical protein EOO04_14875 [Chitinophagaceae bacterium]